MAAILKMCVANNFFNREVTKKYIYVNKYSLVVTLSKKIFVAFYLRSYSSICERGGKKYLVSLGAKRAGR